MMRSFRQLSSVLAASVLLAALGAQSLELDVRGGSMPGTLVLDAYPGLYPFELVMIVPSTTAGPTPLQLVDPNDFRSLEIGVDLVGLAWLGLTDLSGHFQLTLPLVGNPSLQDQALFFQALTFQFQPTLVDRISNGNVIRLANASAFRDRQVQFFDERAFATVVPRPDRKWMLVGGARGQLLAQVATDSTEIYDPKTDSFSFGPVMSTARSLHTSTRLDDGRWLIIGGVNATNDPQASCEVYDPVADSFTSVTSMGTARMGHTATLLGDGRVFVSGGIQAMPTTPTQLEPIHEVVDSTEIYDPVADAWAPGPAMTTPRAAHAAIQRPNGTILLAGGISWSPNILFGWVPAVRSSCDLYDPAANSIVAGPSMASSRSLVDALDLGNDRWLLAGGIGGISIIPYNPGNPTASAEIYDAVANTWSSVGAMATPRGNHRSWALGNGQFLLAGGANNSILSPNPLSSTEVFSTATNTFSPGPAMNSARAGAAMFMTPQGQVQLFGGATSSTSIASTTEWYYY